MNSSLSGSEYTITRPLVLGAFGNGRYRAHDQESRSQITHDLYLPEKSIMKVQYLPRTTKDNIIHFLEDLFQSNQFDKNHLVTMSRIAQDHYARHQDSNALLVPLTALLHVGRKSKDTETILQVSALTKPLIDTAIEDYTHRDKKLTGIAEIILNIARPRDTDLMFQSDILQHFNQSVTDIAPTVKTHSPFSLGEKTTQKVQMLLQQYRNAKADLSYGEVRQRDFADQSIQSLMPFRHGKYAKIN